LLTHALVPSVQEESALRVANALLSAMASWPFCFKNGLAEASDAGAAGVEVAAAAGVAASFADPWFNPAAAVLLPASVAPVMEIRESLSAAVAQVMLVPGLFTNGRAAQIVPPAQAVRANLPPTH